MKNIILITLCLFSIHSLSAQDKLKFGKIDKEDLKMTTYELDEEADAVMLNKSGETHFEVRGDDEVMIYDYHIRIKILTKAGLDYANVELPFYSKKGFEKLAGLKAATYNLVGGKIEKTKVKSRDIFTEEVSERYSMKKFTFPNVKVGSVIEYKYSLKSKSVLQLEDFYFQEDIPVRKSVFKVRVPHFFTYVTMKQITRPFDIEDSKYSNMNFGATIGSIQGIAYWWEMHDVPALKEETFITTMTDYKQRIRLQLQAYNSPRGGSTEYFSTWADTKKEMMEDEHFGERFTKSRQIKPVLEAFSLSYDVAGMSKLEKAKAIFDFVKQNVDWNKDYGVYSMEKPKDVLKAKSGSVGEKNLMLLAMLKYSGIEAHPVLLSTRKHGKPNTFYPILKQFNYVIVQAKIGDKVYLLDAVSSYMPFGYISFKCLNQKGWLMAGESGEWIPIKPAKYTEMTQIIMHLDEKGGAKGIVSTYYGGYAAIDKRNEINTQKEEEYLEDRIKKNVPNIAIDSLTFQNKSDIDKKLIEKIYFQVDELAEVGGNMMYVNPILNEGYEENPFQLKERAYPIDLGYIVSEKIIINVFFPKGYELEELPEPITMALGEGGSGGVFRFISAKAADGSIQIVSSLDLKQPMYPSVEYPYIKQFFDKIVEKQTIELVLKEARP